MAKSLTMSFNSSTAAAPLVPRQSRNNLVAIKDLKYDIHQ